MMAGKWKKTQKQLELDRCEALFYWSKGVGYHHQAKISKNMFYTKLNQYDILLHYIVGSHYENTTM